MKIKNFLCLVTLVIASFINIKCIYRENTNFQQPRLLQNTTNPDIIIKNNTPLDPNITLPIDLQNQIFPDYNNPEIQKKIQNDKFKISIFSVNLSEGNHTYYTKYIDLLKDFTLKNYKKIGKKFAPEDKEYQEEMYKIGANWFIIAGIAAFLFLVYLVLRTFFGKFKGSKQDNIEKDSKIFAWSFFSIFLNIFFLKIKIFIMFISDWICDNVCILYFIGCFWEPKFVNIYFYNSFISS